MANPYSPYDPAEDEGAAFGGQLPARYASTSDQVRGLPFSPQQGGGLPLSTTSSGGGNGVVDGENYNVTALAPRAADPALEAFANGQQPPLTQLGGTVPSMQDLLTQWANGQGGGAFPVLGSSAPSSPITTPAPVSPSAPPMARLLPQSGTMMSPIEQRMQQLMRAQDDYQKLSGWQQFFGGGRQADAATAQLHQLMPVYSQLRQDETARRKNALDTLTLNMKEISDWQDQSVTKQAATRDALVATISARNQAAGINMSPEMLDHALNNKGGVAVVRSLLTDPLHQAMNTPEQMDAKISRIAATKPGTAEMENVLAKTEQETIDAAHDYMSSRLVTWADEYRRDNKLPENANIDGADFQRYMIAKHPEVGGSMLAMKAWNQFVYGKEGKADPVNEQRLAAVHIIPGSVTLGGMKKAAEEAEKGPELSQPTKDVLAEYPHPVTGLPLTPATAAKLPNGPSIIAQASAIAEKRDIKKAASKSYNDAQAIAASKKDEPVGMTLPGKHIINTTTGQEVPITTSWRGIEASGGGKNHIIMDDKQLGAYQTLDTVMSDVARLQELTKTMRGQGPAQVIRAWAYSKTGIDSEVQAIQAYNGLLVRFQKAMTDSGRYNESEAKREAGAFPTFNDSAASANTRLSELAKTLTAHRDAMLGRISFPDLIEITNRARQEIAKDTSERAERLAGKNGPRVVIFPDGSTGMATPEEFKGLPRGTVYANPGGR